MICGASVAGLLLCVLGLSAFQVLSCVDVSVLIAQHFDWKVAMDRAGRRHEARDTMTTTVVNFLP